MNTESFGANTPRCLLRPRSMRWSHDGREGETDLMKQLNTRFVQQLLNSEEFQAFHGTANGDPVLLLADLSDSRQTNRRWQPWEKLLSASLKK